MSRIPEAVKRRIVEHLACYRTHAEVTTLIRDEFNVELTPRHVRSYDPMTFQFAGRPEWVDFHAATRKRFLEDIEGIAIAHRAYRLRQLEDLYHCAKDSGEIPLALSILEQAAKEVGDIYTNLSKVQSSRIVTHLDNKTRRTSDAERTMAADKLIDAIEGMATVNKLTDH